MTTHRRSIVGLACLVVALGYSVLAQGIGGTHWEGGISILGSELKISVDFTTTGDSLKGTIDIPQQGAKDLALKNISFKQPKIHFELPAGPGLAIFDGESRADSINGAFSQSGINGTFHLVRREKKNFTVQEPPVPYNQTEVTFHNGSITLSGTLTLPPTKGPHPAVIMITGSGPQNRDEELFGFKPFRMIADHLTRKGIAVLRYDDRGVGGSTGSMSSSTTADFADDVDSAFAFLLSRPEIDRKHIGLFGHSEGGIVAPMVAARNKNIAFIVLMAGPARPGADIILYQIEQIAREGGASEGEIANALASQKKVYACVQTGTGWEALRTDLRREARASIDEMSPEKRKGIADVDKLIETSVNAKIESAKSPWFKYFIEYDPAPALSKVACPVLAIFGELDRQVPVSLNKAPMEKALKEGGNKDETILVLPSANHLFLKATTGSTKEYMELPKEFVTGFLETIAGWIEKHVRQ